MDRALRAMLIGLLLGIDLAAAVEVWLRLDTGVLLLALFTAGAWLALILERGR